MILKTLLGVWEVSWHSTGREIQLNKRLLIIIVYVHSNMSRFQNNSMQ